MPRGRTQKRSPTVEGAAVSNSGPLVPLDEGALRREVMDALIAVIRFEGAPAMAIATAGRTLAEMLREGAAEAEARPAAEMTMAELDDEIAREQQRRSDDAS